jgi:putative transposase
LVDTTGGKKETKDISANTTVGIDLGIKHFATLSSGIKIDNPKHLIKAGKELRRVQRSLNRKKKGSKSRQRQKVLVAKVFEKITNKRKDFLHKLSTGIINQYDSVAIEDLNVAGMIKNKNLSKHISDVSWGTFEIFLKYKADWCGKNILQIGRFEPSSKMCSCGEINNELKLSHREWTCGHCGTTHDRDILAAQNIKKLGLRTQPNERQREAIACA